MKLRLNSQNIRIRLSASDIEKLEKETKLTESIKIFDSEFSFELNFQKKVKSPQVQIGNRQISIHLPEDEFLSWMRSSEIEYDFCQKAPDEDLQVSIEKDLKDQRSSE